MSDEDGETISTQKIDCHLLAGDTVETQVIYDLTDSITFHKVTLQIETDGEANMTNNSKEIAIGYGAARMRRLQQSIISQRNGQGTVMTGARSTRSLRFILKNALQGGTYKSSLF